MGSKAKVILDHLPVKRCGTIQKIVFFFCPITSNIHPQVAYNKKRHPIDFGGSKANVNLDTLPVKLCGHNSGISFFFTITFKLHMQVANDEWRNPIIQRSSSL